MKKNEFKLTVKGEEETGMSSCTVEFDGTVAQFMDVAGSTLAAAKKAFVDNFEGDNKDLLTAFKAAVVEFMEDGFNDGEKAFRDIALEKVIKQHDDKQKAELKKLLNENEDIKSEFFKLLNELKAMQK